MVDNNIPGTSTYTTAYLAKNSISGASREQHIRNQYLRTAYPELVENSISGASREKLIWSQQSTAYLELVLREQLTRSQYLEISISGASTERSAYLELVLREQFARSQYFREQHNWSQYLEISISGASTFEISILGASTLRSA